MAKNDSAGGLTKILGLTQQELKPLRESLGPFTRFVSSGHIRNSPFFEMNFAKPHGSETQIHIDLQAAQLLRDDLNRRF